MNSMRDMMTGMSKGEMPEMMKKMMKEFCAGMSKEDKKKMAEETMPNMMKEFCAGMSKEETKNFVDKLGEKMKACCGC